MNNKDGWFFGDWPALAWLETVIKLVGMVYGFAALSTAVTVGSFKLPTGLQLFQWVILLVLSLGLAAAITDRLKEREIIAMVFVILNNIAHWGMVLGLSAAPQAGLSSFVALFLIGDLVKIVFIRTHAFTVREYSTTTLTRLTFVYILGYLLILIAGWF